MGPRKAIFDAIRCGSLPVLVGERTPLPFAATTASSPAKPKPKGGRFARDVEQATSLATSIDYSEFAIRVPESPNASHVIEHLHRLSDGRVRRMRAAMARAAALLDYGPHGRLVEAVLERFSLVAGGTLPSVPPTTKTPLPLTNFEKLV